MAANLYSTDSLAGQVLLGATDGTGAAICLRSGDYPDSPRHLNPLGLAVDNSSVYGDEVHTDRVLFGGNDGSGAVGELFGRADYLGPPSNIDSVLIPIDRIAPKPTAIALATLGAAALGWCGWRRARKNHADRRTGPKT